MPRRIAERRKRVWRAACFLFLLLAAAGAGQAQTVRGPDLGVWFRHERAADGSNALMVADVIVDGVLERAGLRGGDRVVSINGRRIEREPQLVDAFWSAGNRELQLVVERAGRQQTLVVRASAVMNAMVPADPLYQAGLLIAEDSAGPVVVKHVFNLTPAFYAGLKTGDVITSISGQPILSAADLLKVLQRGGTLAVVVNRDGQTRQLSMLIWNDRATRRRSLLGGSLTPADNQRPPLSGPVPAVPSAPLLAPPVLSNPPALPSPPPAIPVLPPPGTAPNGPRF